MTSRGLQLSLYDTGSPGPDPEFASLVSHDLDGRARIDHAPNWVRGSVAVFDEIAGSVPFEQHERRMYDGYVAEPRLTAFWHETGAEFDLPAAVVRMRSLLGRRYGVSFDSVGFALYRDGSDSVAWHSDRVGRKDPDAIVALVSLGDRRRLLVRPRGGGASRRFELGSGDLLVMVRCQRDWEHTVPKVTRAGPRISLGFRHGEEASAPVPARRPLPDHT